LKIATWNVNSVRARVPHLAAWLSRFSPDVVLLQELKCTDADFPVLEIEAAGYKAAFQGQKSYNGVAILAREAIENVAIGLPGDPQDEQARYIEATVSGVRVASIYLPNGNPNPGPKFDYKL
jgi:exodeoxyribonuclease-3